MELKMAYSFTPPPILYLFNIYASCFYIFVNSTLHGNGVERAQTTSTSNKECTNDEHPNNEHPNNEHPNNECTNDEHPNDVHPNNECANIRHTNNERTNNEETGKRVQTNYVARDRLQHHIVMVLGQTEVRTNNCARDRS